MSSQLEVVVWKNLIIRKRHWILTIIESLLPILLFLLIAYGRSKISGLNKIEVTEATYVERDPVLYISFNSVDETLLIYTPDDEFHKDIIKRTQIKLQMYNNNILGFATAEKLLRYYRQHHNGSSNVIAVIFNGSDEKKFDYTIRYNDDGSSSRFLHTKEKYKNKYRFLPGEKTDYQWKGFLSLQKALDMSFIEKSFGGDLEDNTTIFTQEFPYPPHKVDSAINSVFITYLPLITLFSFIFVCPAVLKRVVEEKYSGIKELMKMVGMKSWMLWLGWVIYAMIPMLFSIICIVLLMKVPFFGTEYPPVEYSDGTILFIFLLMYCMAAVVFCFALSSLYSKPTIAMVTGILIWILSYFIPKYSLGLEESESNNKLSWSVNMLLNLLPNMALHYGYSAISLYEERELGIRWNNFYKSSSGSTDEVTMLNVLLMLLLDVVVYMIFTFYMDGVNPGKYGVRKHLFFPIFSLIKFVKTILGKNDVKIDAESAHLENVEEGRGMKRGIEIQHLYKRFGHKIAVNNLNLDIYQNQITVLLGHNGAGKSTTMSMITGMLEATSGSIKINGKDVKNNIDEIRQTLGLCPQHNLLFTDLTVGEHLIFFAKLKGKAPKEAHKEMHMLLKKLHLSKKKNDMASTLSGGMKRKLCLGMALIGGSDVLILDEPSSGMDPESRRELWDLLLAWRGEKTILITTHFMEEADALGDWIAIMANGTLQCYGTPIYLKKMYNTGYHLSLMIKSEATKEDGEVIKRQITNHILEAQFKALHGNNMVFILPIEKSREISNLLCHLEEKKDELKIDNISVTITTLEDVFLKAKMESDPIGCSTTLDSDDSNFKRQNLGTIRFKALLIKRWNFLIKKFLTYLIPVLIAFMFFALTVLLSKGPHNYYSNNGPELKLDLSTYKDTTVFYNGTHNNPMIEKMKAFYKKEVENSHGLALYVEDVAQAIISEGVKNIIYYKEYVIASAEFLYANGIDATALYNGIAVHSAPISLSLVTNAIAKAYLGKDYSITASNWPLETIDTNVSQTEYSEAYVGILWLVMVPIGCLFVHASFILFPHMEMSTKFLQLQYMCGVKPRLYWTINFISDLGFFAIIAVIMALVICTFSGPFQGTSQFGVLCLILLMYGLSDIPFAYLFSRRNTVSGAFSLFIIQGIFLGIILTVIIGVMIESMDDYYIRIGEVLKYMCMLFLPQVALTYSGIEFARKAVNNYNMMSMPKRMLSICSYNPNPCCTNNVDECEKYKSYLPLLKYNFCVMLMSFIMYLVINVLLDSYTLKKVRSKFMYYVYSLIYRKKRSYNKTIISKDGSRSNTLNARNLNKTYSNREIIKDVCFTLNDGECLGILGVNGAGKTTTFRMLTREEVVDEGEVVQIAEQNRNIKIDSDEYLEKLGYCPQSDALNFVLTGRQILSLISHLRGIDDPKIVDLFLKMFELEEYADRPCGYYSGGNKRKLSLAVALIGYPKYILLDEPTNGVDPSCRRKFWSLIKSVQEKKKLSFILTSHSMIECEALCNNLKIMKDGRFEKEGTISNLKKEFGGFSVKLKLVTKDNMTQRRSSKDRDSAVNDPESYDEVDSVPLITENPLKFSTVENLKEYFETEYSGEIKDEHSGLLHFYIKDKNKRWSTIFREVEHIKMNNPHLIEDYAISEASLEDIFLSVARSGTK